ncbi:MAG: hypothetical protein V3T29_05200 [Alphaproteobacteria bacterium]
MSAALPGASFAEAWDRDSLARLLASPGEARALGLARIRVAHDEGELKSLAVVPSARRRAPGTLLLLASLERFQVNWNRSQAAPG